MISLRGVTKRFAGAERDAVCDLSLEIAEGKTLVLLGSSGCGKTTTLKMINRLIEPTCGEIEVDGVNVRAQNVLTLRRSIGYVFQDVGLFPHMTIAQNVSIAGRLDGWDRARREARAEELLELVGLDAKGCGDRLPGELSGGQQQRVGIARALATQPKYMLMDEPFGALDAITRDQMQRELMRLRVRLGVTIVFVTHDVFEALRLGDRIGVMHEGKLEQVGTPGELLGAPGSDFVRGLFDHARGQAELLAEVSR